MLWTSTVIIACTPVDYPDSMWQILSSDWSSKQIVSTYKHLCELECMHVWRHTHTHTHSTAHTAHTSCRAGLMSQYDGKLILGSTFELGRCSGLPQGVDCDPIAEPGVFRGVQLASVKPVDASDLPCSSNPEHPLRLTCKH